MTEEGKDQATVTDTKEQAKEQETEEQQKPIPETQPQRDGATSTTTPEEVNLANSDGVPLILYQFYSYVRDLMIANQLKVIRLA